MTDADQWAVQENRYKFTILIDILLTLEFDETGRTNLKEFIAKVLSTRTLEEEIIQKLVSRVESLYKDDPDNRLQFFVDIIRGYTDPTECTFDFGDGFISRMLDGIKDPNIRMNVTKLRLKILDLREQETNATQQKNYERVEKILEELNQRTDELVRTVCEVYPEHATTINSTLRLDTKKMSRESTVQCLQIFFFAVASEETRTLTPAMVQLYTEFVCRQMESKHMSLRDWALRCGIACSMLYEQLAKEAYNRLTAQFYKHHNTCIWTTSIKGAFELIDKYGFEYFEQDGEVDKTQSKAKKTRQLYNTMGFLNETPEEDDQIKQGRDIIFLFAHFMDTCEEMSIIKALITGFCRLVLSGRFQTADLVSKLMLKFFSPATDPEINQTLGIFFQALIARKQQECMAKALLPTLYVFLDAPNDSPLREVKPESVIKFVVNATMPAYCSPGLNIHNDIALEFLSDMNDKSNNKELLKLLSKELLTLQVADDSSLRDDLQSISDNLLDRTIDAKTESYIKDFKEVLAGTYKGPGSRPTDIRLTGVEVEIDGELLDTGDAIEGEERLERDDAEAIVEDELVIESGTQSPQIVTSTQKTDANSQSVMETSDIRILSNVNASESVVESAVPVKEIDADKKGAKKKIAVVQPETTRGKKNQSESAKMPTEIPSNKRKRNGMPTTPIAPAADTVCSVKKCIRSKSI